MQSVIDPARSENSVVEKLGHPLSGYAGDPSDFQHHNYSLGPSGAQMPHANGRFAMADPRSLPYIDS